MRRDERIHERLKVRPPPLCKRVAHLPLIVDTFACELCTNWGQSLVQPCFEAFDLVVFGAEVITGPV